MATCKRCGKPCLDWQEFCGAACSVLWETGDRSPSHTPPSPVSSFRPLGDRLLVREVKEDDRLSSGLYVVRNEPGGEKAVVQRGRVLRVGPGRRVKLDDGSEDPSGERVPVAVREGALVLFRGWDALVTYLAGEKLLVVRESAVLAEVVEE